MRAHLNWSGANVHVANDGNYESNLADGKSEQKKEREREREARARDKARGSERRSREGNKSNEMRLIVSGGNHNCRLFLICCKAESESRYAVQFTRSYQSIA